MNCFQISSEDWRGIGDFWLLVGGAKPIIRRQKRHTFHFQYSIHFSLYQILAVRIIKRVKHIDNCIAPVNILQVGQSGLQSRNERSETPFWKAREKFFG